MRVVVDASVIVKWYLSEPDSAEAERLHDEETIAPELWISETANALWKRQARGDIDQRVLDGFAATAPTSTIQTEPIAQDIAAALDLARRLHHPVYDCLYLASAIRNETHVVTADRKFFAVVTCDADLAAHIRLLGA
ncbi:MAG: type II toxin-antitoxin system VapC family toxin [Caulobacteraceae bacterium]|nr:type II toxin-antitoxin system VapC family toxin [Caulobacteraceae bacterium]